METEQKDECVERLVSWANSMKLTSEQYNTLSAIMEWTVKTKLREFAEEFIKMDVLEFRKTQSDEIKNKQDCKGLWS